MLGCLLICGALGLSSASAAPRVLAQATVEVRLIIERFVLVTDMRVMPRVLELDCPEGEPPVHICLDLPSFLKCSDVRLDTIQLNSVPISPVPPPTKWKADKDATRCHIFFDRKEVVDILGPPSGYRTIQFQGEIGGGHLITAVDIVWLLPTKGETASLSESTQQASDWLTGSNGRVITCTLAPTTYLGHITPGAYTLIWSQ